MKTNILASCLITTLVSPLALAEVGVPERACNVSLTLISLM